MDDVIYRDRAVYLSAADTLVVADLHLGREAVANVDAPLGAQSDIRSRLETLIAEFEPAQLIFAGDLLHSFSTLPAGVERAVGSLYELCSEQARVRAVKGNHDQLLEEIWPGTVETELTLKDGTVICHGHEPPSQDTSGQSTQNSQQQSSQQAQQPTQERRYLIGHEHPAISIEGKRHPCLCVDPTGYRGCPLIILPAFTRLAGGVELNTLQPADLQSPLISAVDSLQPTVWDGETETALEFPPIGEFRRLL